MLLCVQNCFQYCECYAGNVRCSAACRCFGCQNINVLPNGTVRPPPLDASPPHKFKFIKRGRGVNKLTDADPTAHHISSINAVNSNLEAAQNLAFLKHGNTPPHSAEKKQRLSGSTNFDDEDHLPSLAVSSEDSTVTTTTSPNDASIGGTSTVTTSSSVMGNCRSVDALPYEYVGTGRRVSSTSSTGSNSARQENTTDGLSSLTTSCPPLHSLVSTSPDIHEPLAPATGVASATAEYFASDLDLLLAAQAMAEIGVAITSATMASPNRTSMRKLKPPNPLVDLNDISPSRRGNNHAGKRSTRGEGPLETKPFSPGKRLKESTVSTPEPLINSNRSSSASKRRKRRTS
jgi:hypothetical protein